MLLIIVTVVFRVCCLNLGVTLISVQFAQVFFLCQRFPQAMFACTKTFNSLVGEHAVKKAAAARTRFPRGSL